MSATTHGATPHYYVPPPSSHPVMAAAGLFFVILGAATWLNGVPWGPYSFWFGIAWWLLVLFQWFREAAHESEGGLYGHKVDVSFRWSMSWFIFSEVMFFGAFFTALWWGRVHSVPHLANVENALLWPGFQGIWPSVAAGVTASPAGTGVARLVRARHGAPLISTTPSGSTAVTAEPSSPTIQPRPMVGVEKRVRTMAGMSPITKINMPTKPTSSVIHDRDRPS